MNIEAAMAFSVTFASFYAGHHLGDYWVQTDHQAAHKGLAGWAGRWACLKHVLSYTATQGVLVALAAAVLDWSAGWPVLVALAVSAVTHYAADRRGFGPMFWLARLIPGKGRFLTLGVPRAGRDDNPSLGTGAWALDQSWHIALGVFLPALVMAWTA
jgi:hypothetical protein